MVFLVQIQSVFLFITQPEIEIHGLHNDRSDRSEEKLVAANYPQHGDDSRLIKTD